MLYYIYIILYIYHIYIYISYIYIYIYHIYIIYIYIIWFCLKMGCTPAILIGKMMIHQQKVGLGVPGDGVLVVPIIDNKAS